MAALLQFLRRLFTKPVAPPPPGSIPERYWEADLSSQDSSCFIPELDERYRTQLSGNTLNLELLRPGIFAWTEAQPYRYRDFSLVGRIQLPSGSPADSAGFILRMADAGSFVCVLASARGLRMDVFFNGDPRTIVPWTPCPWISLDDGVVLSIVARDSRYLVFADSRFAFEAEDESTEAGILAFAARNEGKPGSAVLHSLAIESRPVEVEVAFYHLMRLGASDTEQRRRLARSLFSNGDYLTALIHLKKLDEASIARERLLLRSGDTTRGNSEPGSETQDLASNAGRSEERVGDAFLRAECYLRLQMYEDAEKAILACLAMDPEHSEAQEERFNLLYIQGRLKELRDNLAAVPNKVAVNPRLSNLQAHAFFEIGRAHV